jgi:hypothetical protein
MAGSLSEPCLRESSGAVPKRPVMAGSGPAANAARGCLSARELLQGRSPSVSTGRTRSPITR